MCLVNSNSCQCFRSPVLRLLTGCQVEDDANRGRVVDDVRPLVQVVHVVAAVVATITEHQLQHQVLRGSQRKTA